VNAIWPGYVAGEWHNNHHLFPNSARSGFLPHQLDLAWQFIRFGSAIGAVSSYNDSKADFYEQHYLPYLARLSAPQANAPRAHIEARVLAREQVEARMLAHEQNLDS
jgi:stearoyl-CoA desaturase (delta-9 desaturase)